MTTNATHPEIILNVCPACAEKAGSRPKPYPVGVWLGKCCGCGQETGCTAPRDWVPYIQSFDHRKNALLNAKKPRGS